MKATDIVWVIGKRQMLHRQDCPHPVFTGAPDPEWEEATPDEIRQRPECHDCQVKRDKYGDTLAMPVRAA
jgi:hypothetical protein